MIIIAYLMDRKGDAEIQMLGVKSVKDYAKKISAVYGKIMDGELVFCHGCNEFHASTNFYNDKRFASGLYPLCKKILLGMATDYDKKNKIYVDNREKTIKVFQMLDIPFIDSVYQSALQTTQEAVGEKNRSTAYQHMLTMIKSLPQWKGMTFENSDFGDIGNPDDSFIEESKKNEKIINKGRKRFGNYSNEDLLFLENEYEDWITRYECNTKAQESIFERLSFKKWEINKATKNGQPTKDLDKTYQELLSTANITPRQTSMDTFADAQTMGTLLQKYEETRPLPEIDEELRDVDKIGLYIDAFYRGHAAKMLGIKNTFTHIYEKVMSKYMVKPPTYEDEEDSEKIFDKIFGSVEDY